MATTPKLLTYEEWVELPEVGYAIEEVANGEVRINPPNKWNHAVIVHAMDGQLRTCLDKKEVFVVSSFGLVIRRRRIDRRARSVDRVPRGPNDSKLATTAILREGQLRPKLFPEAAVDIPSIWQR